MDYMLIPSLSQLAWMSEQIVVATVEGQVDPAWWDGRIYAGTRVHVDEQIRGRSEPALDVRQWGGTIGDCTQEGQPTIIFWPGDRYLLFLIKPTAEDAPAGHLTVGGLQSAWPIDPDGTVHVTVPHYRQFNGKPLSEVVEAIRAALEAGPPVGSSIGSEIVPLDRAPLALPDASLPSRAS
jgi:hypothetical protein